MKKLSALLVTLVMALALAMPALAHQCPRLMKQVDDKVATMSLAADTAAKVKELRQAGEDLHKAGKHTASVATLQEALRLLGS